MNLGILRQKGFISRASRVLSGLVISSFLISPFTVFAEEEFATSTPEVASTTEPIEVVTTSEAIIPTETSDLVGTSTPEVAIAPEITEATNTLEVADFAVTKIYLPIYLFGDERGGILGVAPISENASIWTYAPNFKENKTSQQTAMGSSSENVEPNSDEYPKWTPLGVLVIALNSLCVPKSGDLGNEGCIGHDVTTSYQYDALYRLQGATTTNSYANYTQSYVYDWLGNITNKSDQGAYTYAATGYTNPDAVTSIGAQNYAYDNAGNLLTSGNGSATTSYTWNYRNRMTDTSRGATSTHYAYDTSDQRVQMDQRINGAATTTNKYFNQYYETTGATTTLYVFAGGQLVATIEGKGSATSTNIIHTDHLGGTGVVSSATGTAVQVLSYYPFGDLRINQKNTATFDEKRKAIGQYYDDATSLNYLNARYLGSSRGQFMSQDPMFTGDPNQQNLTNPQNLNAYSYADNNPINKKDPDGLTPVDALFTAYFTGAYAAGQFFSLGVGQLTSNQFLVSQSTQNLNATLNADNLGLAMTLANEAPPGVGSLSAMRQVMMGGERTALTAAERLQANKAAGSAFEQKTAKNLIGTQPDLTSQVTIKTADGTKTRLDFVGTNGNGSICLTECKSSATAPLTANQSKAFPQIQQSGGVVVGQGKSNFPGGTIIPPTKVNVVRPAR